MLVEKHISRVNTGSFVVKVIKQRGDREVKQEFWVHNLQAIESLIDMGVERVLVDTSRSLQKSYENDLENKSAIKPNKFSIELSFAEKLNQAKELFDSVAQVQVDVLAQVKAGEALYLKPIQQAISELIKYIHTDHEALTCIINVRNQQNYQIEHAVAVTVLIIIFARHLNLKQSIVQDISIGAFIHDAGKVLIDESILNKPGQVTKEEFEIIKSHVNQSINIIKSTHGISKLSLQVVAQHHEKLNGSGYPKGFDQRVISQYARMLAICDIYDALSNSKIYKAKLTQAKSFSALLEMAGDNLLDNPLVNSFIKCLGIYPTGSLVKLNTDQLALVISQNSEQALKPKIRLFYNATQEHFINSLDLDLAVETNYQIEKLVAAEDYNLSFNKIMEFIMLGG